MPLTSPWPMVLPCTSVTSTPVSRAWAYLGVFAYIAKHKASSSVDFPDPVGPVMAKIPAEQSGSSVKSIAVTPSSEARFFMRTANIFMLVPPSGAPVGPPHERGRTTPPAPRCHIGLHIPWQRHLPAGAPA